MWLTSDELCQMTETNRRRLQQKWLDQHRIPYTLGSKGGLNVLRETVVVLHSSHVPKNATPNYKAFTT
jgi:hypothetical protein